MSDSPERSENSAGQVTRGMIEQRAYELSQQEGADTPEENWERAERQLLAERSNETLRHQAPSRAFRSGDAGALRLVRPLAPTRPHESCARRAFA